MPSIHDGAEKQAENKKNPDVPDAEKDDDPIESFGQLLLPAASATLANVAMNNIGVDPWKRELDLSDTQF